MLKPRRPKPSISSKSKLDQREREWQAQKSEPIPISNNYERLENQDTDFIEIHSDEQENVEAKDKPKENISNSSKSA